MEIEIMNKETYFKKSVKLCIKSLCFLPISIIIEAILFFISDSMYINAGYISPKNDLKYKLVNIMFELVFPIYLIISLILFVRNQDIIKCGINIDYSSCLSHSNFHIKSGQIQLSALSHISEN